MSTKGVTVEIKPNMVFDLQSATAALGLNRTTLPREIKLGRLRAARRAGKVFLLGRWLLAWLREGVVSPQPAATDGSAPVA